MHGRGYKFVSQRVAHPTPPPPRDDEIVVLEALCAASFESTMASLVVGVLDFFLVVELLILTANAMAHIAIYE